MRFTAASQVNSKMQFNFRYPKNSPIFVNFILLDHLSETICQKRSWALTFFKTSFLSCGPSRICLFFDSLSSVSRTVGRSTRKMKSAWNTPLIILFKACRNEWTRLLRKFLKQFETSNYMLTTNGWIKLSFV